MTSERQGTNIVVSLAPDFETRWAESARACGGRGDRLIAHRSGIAYRRLAVTSRRAGTTSLPYRSRGFSSVPVHQVEVELVNPCLGELMQLLDVLRGLPKDAEAIRHVVADEGGVGGADLPRWWWSYPSRSVM